MFQALEILPLPEGVQPIPIGVKPDPKYRVQILKDAGGDLGAAESDRDTSSSDEKFDQNNPFLAPLLRNERLTPAQHFQVSQS